MGIIINVIAVIIGTSIGLIINKSIPKKLSDTVMQGLILCTLVIGMQNALKSKDILCLIFAVSIGGALGSWINIQSFLNNMTENMQKKFANNKDGKFSEAFLSSSLIMCVGAMAIVGSLECGINGNNSLLYSKSALDFVSSIIFASSFGFGVYFSALSILVYQGSIAILASIFSRFIGPEIINEISAVGGLLIIALGINMLMEKDISIANLLPALFIPIIYIPIFNFIISLL